MRTPLRILHVTTYIHPDRKGGAERVVHGLARAQAGAGHEVVVVTGHHDPRASLPSEESLDGFRLLRFRMPRGVRGYSFYRAARRGCRALLRPLVRHGFDLVHTHQPATAGSALAMPHLARVRVHSFYAPYAAEWTAEQERLGPGNKIPRNRMPGDWKQVGLDLKRRALNLLDRRCLDRAHRVVVLSETSSRQVEQICPGIAHKIERVPPGVDLDRFRPEPDRPANSRPLILAVRRLVKRMGLDLALEAASLLRDQGREFELLIAGAGPQAGHLAESIQALRLGDRVRLLGPVPESELPDLYRRADLFLLPTRQLEGFGMVTLEALACGTPVLATDVGASSGLLLELTPELPPVPCRPDRLAEAIGGVLDQLAPARAAALRAAREIAERYGWPAAAARLEHVYREALTQDPVS